MAIKKVKLTEADLNRIVKKVMNEQILRNIANNVGLGGAYDAVADATGQIYDKTNGMLSRKWNNDVEAAKQALGKGSSSSGFGGLSSGFGGLSGLLAGGVSALLDKFRGQQRQRIENIANTLNSLQTKPVPDWVITNSKNPALNGMTWSQFSKKYSLTPEIMQAAKALAYDMKQQGGAGGAARDSSGSDIYVLAAS